MMNRLCLILALITFFPLAYGDDPSCHDLMIARAAVGDDETLTLKNLSAQLPANQKSALLFKINLSGIKPSLSSLIELTESDRDVEINPALRLFNEGSLLFIAQGQPEGLVKLLKRIWDMKLVRQTSLFNLAANAMAPLAAPKELVQTEDDFVQARLQQRTFAVFVQNQVSFMVPREQVQAYSDIFAKEKIQTSRIARTPVSWTAWISRKTDELRGRSIVFTGDWALVSNAAFGSLQDAAEKTRSVVSDEALQLNRQILGQLSRPESASTATAAVESEPERDNITKPVRGLINAYLSDHRGRTSLSKSEGIERAFMALAKLVPNQRSAEIYRRIIKEIGFGRWDYQSTNHEIPTAIDRYIQGWRAFLTATKNPYAELPVTLRNTKEAIKQLPE